MVDAAVLSKKRVAVLMGGDSVEREISLMSGKAVLAALRSSGVNAFAFDPQEQSILQLPASKPDLVFIVLHGPGGEDGRLQGFLETTELCYTGSGVAASALAMDKAMTKQVWQQCGLPTPAWIEVCSEREAEQAAKSLGCPMMFKAAHQGSTLGLAKAENAEGVGAAYLVARKLESKVIAERWIAGDEVTVAILGDGDAMRILPAVEIVAPGGNYDYEHKYFSDKTQYICPSQLPAQELEHVAELARTAHEALGCQGWGRIDFMIERETRQPYLLEANTVPGMTGHSLFPMAAQALGIGFEELCLQIAVSALVSRERQ